MADNNLIYGDEYTSKFVSEAVDKKERERNALIKEAMHKELAHIPTAKYGESPQAAIWRDKAEKLENQLAASQQRAERAEAVLMEILTKGVGVRAETADKIKALLKGATP
jgi:hypothetical protein